jgi:peroxiredoxin
MARTPSNMLALGTKAPDFTLTDTVSGDVLKLEDLKGTNGTMIMFICNHCPFVIHINPEIVKIANHYAQQGIGFIAISSNDAENYPQDGPKFMASHAKENHYPFPYLYDATQDVANAYDAACTPDFYVFNQDSELVYRGQLDDSRPGNGVPVTGHDLRQALDCLVSGNEHTEAQKPSIGCNIKWKG